MATTMNSPRIGRGGTTTFVTRDSIQKVCIVMGYAFVLIGIVGVVMPGLMGLHLSMAHNLIHLLSGALALAFGYSADANKALTFSVAFGVVYGLLGVAGFLIGQPGYPGVGYMQADQNLLRVIPNILEFGTMDHSVHLIISAAFLFSAYVWKKSHVEADRALVDIQKGTVDTGKVQTNSAANLSRLTDEKRKSDIEKRV